MGVYLVGKGYATQGPCPDGFHVPTNDEWTAVYNAGVTIGAWDSNGANNMSAYLKLPFAGARDTTGAYGNQGSYGWYWSSTAASANNSGGIRIVQSSGAITLPSWRARSFGQPIRPFKDVAVTPDSSWTELYTNGIYWSSTLGLISIKNGNNRITIADKNLGATSTDISSSNSYGYVYQRGNNYGFSISGSVTTSGNAIDASIYGPGNYYNSSTFITVSARDSSNNLNLRGGEDGNVPVQKELKNAYIGEYVTPYLCFTANTAGSTVQLNKSGSPTAVTLETSTDGTNWSTYTFGDTITLSNVGDKVYWRNTSETTTGFSTSGSAYYYFSMIGSIAAGGDLNYLINKNSTTTLGGDCCFYNIFNGCSVLTSAPKLSATTLTLRCYTSAFLYCSELTTLPTLSATTYPTECCKWMFYGCSKIKLSTTQTGEYQTPYRIPTEGTGTVGDYSLQNMFYGTGGTFTGTPTKNTTYYTSNTVV